MNVVSVYEGVLGSSMCLHWIQDFNKENHIRLV